MLSKVPPPFAVSGAGGSASSGTVVFSNSNNVSFGQNGLTLTASASVAPGFLSAGGATASLGTVVFSDSNGLAFGVNGQTLTGSYTQSGQAFSAGAASSAFQTLSFQDSNGVSFSNNAGAVRVTHDLQLTSGTSAITSNALHTSASRVFNVVAATNNTGGGTASLSSNVSLSNANGATFYTSAGGAVALSYTVPTLSNSSLTMQAGASTLSSVSRIAFVDSNGISFGASTSNNGSITITATVQTNYLTTADLSANSSNYARNWKLTGNTAGTTSSAIGTDLWIAGGNNITVSGSSNSITISGANAGGAQTGISGIVVSNTTYTSGTVSFSNANGISFGSSAGQAITASYTVPVVTNSSWTVSDSATSATVGRLAFTAANGITMTLSTSNNGNHTVFASYTVPTVTNSSLTVSDAATSGTLARLAFTNLNGVTLSLSTGAGGSHTIVGSHNAITTGALSGDTSKYVQNWKLTGNTAGTTSSAQGTDLWFSGGNSITVSGNSNTVVFSVGAYITTADLSANSSKYVQNWKLTGNTAGTTSSAQGTDLWFSGGNSITVSGNSNTIVFSVGAYLTTADLSANSSNYVRNWKLTGNTAGTTSSAQGTDFWLAGGNGVTVSGSSNTISLSVATNYQSQGAYLTTAALSGDTSKYVQAWELEGANTAGTTSSAQGTKLYLSGGNNITLSGNSNTIIISAPNLGAGAFSGGASTDGNTAGSTGITGTQLVLVGSGVVSLSQATGSNGGTLSILAPATSSLSATGWASISVNGSTISIGASTTQNAYAVGNTFGTSSGTVDIRTLSISGAGAAYVAASNSGLVVSVAPMATLNHWENLEWQGANSATSTFGLSTGFFMPVEPQATLQWNQAAMIVSASLPVTSCGNTQTVSFGTTGQSQQFDANYTGTFANLIDLYLLSRGAGGSSSDLVTVSSTRNSVVTYLYETFRVFASAPAAATTNAATVSNTVSVQVSFPAVTSATSTSVNAGTSVTLWGPGYSSWGSTASGSTSSSKATGATMSISIGSTYPATTVWSSNKLVQFGWGASTLAPGLYWLGLVRGSSSASSLSTAQTSIAAGRSYTSSINCSDLTMTAQLTYAGQTNSVLSSLGTFGGDSLAAMAPGPGHGTYTATYAGTKTFMNNAGQANGEIALSDIRTATSLFKPWVQLNSNRF